MRRRRGSTTANGDANFVPAPDPATVRLVVDSLGTPLHALLRSDDPQVLAERLLLLDPGSGDPEDAARLDTLVSDPASHRRTVLELASRLLVTAVLVLVVLAAGLLAASFAGAQFTGHAHGHRSALLAWPPSHTVLAACVGLAGVAWLLGWTATLLRGRDRLQRARSAIGDAAALRTGTWPGLLLDPPYLQRARRLTLPATTLACLAMGLVALAGLDGSAGAGARVLDLLGALVLAALGALLWWRGRHLRRADDLAGRTLFVGRRD